MIEGEGKSLYAEMGSCMSTRPVGGLICRVPTRLLLSTSLLEHDQTTERDAAASADRPGMHRDAKTSRVTKDLQSGDLGAECKDGSRDEQLRIVSHFSSLDLDYAHNVLEHTSKSQDQSRSDRDEEDGGDLDPSASLSLRQPPPALTFRAKAIPALVNKTKSPTRCRA
jgi:hypothetical protein